MSCLHGAEVISLGSDSEPSSEVEVLKMRKCFRGHSVLSRSENFECNFCRDLFRSHREYATRRGGTLVSRASDRVLLFRCHRKNHAEFSLSFKKPSFGSQWCPQCNPDKSRVRLLPSTSSHSLHAPSTSASDPRLEEGKRRQANLLESARMLYKISTMKDIIFPPVPSSLMSKVLREADQDSDQLPDVPKRQCLVVRALLNCKDWSLVAQGLEVDAALGPEKLFRLAAKQVHPDKCKHPKAGEAFKILSSLLS